MRPFLAAVAIAVFLSGLGAFFAGPALADGGFECEEKDGGRECEKDNGRVSLEMEHTPGKMNIEIENSAGVEVEVKKKPTQNPSKMKIQIENRQWEEIEITRRSGVEIQKERR